MKPTTDAIVSYNGDEGTYTVEFLMVYDHAHVKSVASIEGYLSRAEAEHVADNWIHRNYILAPLSENLQDGKIPY